MPLPLLAPMFDVRLRARAMHILTSTYTLLLLVLLLFGCMRAGAHPKYLC